MSSSAAPVMLPTDRGDDLPAREASPGDEATVPLASAWTQGWPDIQQHVAARPRLLLALGFDGILSPTVAHPSDAVLPAETRALLHKLAGSPRLTVCFFTGRPLADIRSRLDFPHAYYVGNHGMEVGGPGLHSSDGLATSCRSDLVDALAFLARYTKRLRGVFIEDKGLTVTVHWHQADEAEGKALRELLEAIVQNHPRLKIFGGEACWELRARAAWNKGDALRQILSHLRLSPADTIYLGDAFTDEPAFAQLTEGLTFCVGGAAGTFARYSLPSAHDTGQFLFCLLCAANGIPLT